MQEIEQTGKSVEEAVAAALKALGAAREEVDVEVLSESGRGLLGIFGQTEARVKVTRRASVGTRAGELTNQILALLGIEAKVSLHSEDAEGVLLEIDAGDDTGLIIGRRGETLGSLQYLVALVVNRGETLKKRILLNAGGYLERREQALQILARRTAQKVRASGRPVTLEALSPRERRIIHMALSDEPGITTSSIGTDPNRRVVVSPADSGRHPGRPPRRSRFHGQDSQDEKPHESVE
jgi:spoIIIJ-associated protein